MIAVSEEIKATTRLLAIKQAREKLMPFMKLSMPSPDDPANVDASRFIETPQAKLLCQIVEKMIKGELNRVAVSIGPQMGKSQILSRGAPAWISGRDPYKNVMLGTYNQTFAEEFGVDVRTIMESDVYKKIFPKHSLDKSAADHLITNRGGKLSFVGVGGSGTGKPADFFFVDDPLRNDEDAQSATYRDKIWKWFNSVVFSRIHNDAGILVVHTRWHQDDLIGRLCDPDHPERNKSYAGIAEKWKYFNLPVIVEDPELAEALGLTLVEQTDPEIVAQFGSKPKSALWPEKKSLKFLAEVKQMDARVFGALYMGNPTPEDGDYFKSADFVEYNRDELPQNLRKYGASDHAVGTKQRNDSSVLGCVGIDDKDNVWVLPDITWGRFETDRTVEEMIGQMKRHKPMLWWMESELISKSFGPFLKKRMNDEKVYTYIDPVTVSKSDKQLRARSIQGRMQMRKVFFPRFAPWFADCKAQFMKFPYGAHDDFVDFLAHIGLGLLKELPADTFDHVDKQIFRTGSPNWLFAKAKERVRKRERQKNMGGW